jgi:hypothetical protein
MKMSPLIIKIRRGDTAQRSGVPEERAYLLERYALSSGLNIGT